MHFFYFLFVGSEAKRLFDDAQAMLTNIVDNKLLQANGVVGLFPAYTKGDDIKVLSVDRQSIQGTLYGLRQQV